MRVRRTVDAEFDWCTSGRHFAPVSEFHTVTRRNGLVARQSHCKACKLEYVREMKRQARSPDDGRKFRAWRPPTGELSHCAKITDAQRQEIISRWDEPARDLAIDYSISRSRVYQIWRGE